MPTLHSPAAPSRFAALLAPFALCLAVGCGDTAQENNGDGGGGVTTNNSTQNCPAGQSYDSITKECYTPNTGNNGTGNNNNPPVDPCSDESKFVYAVDATEGSYSLLKFNPTTSAFEDLGALSCPTGNPQASPFSMSVDRDARAWVLYSDGNIYIVDTETLGCTKSAFQPNQRGIGLFGMGFVLDAEKTDILHIAGGQNVNSTANATLASVGSNSLMVNPIGQLNGWPELTGTALGDLWAFFPGGGRPRVSRISRTDGSEGTSYSVTGIDGQPNAWAFAAWGGDFYLFYKSQTDPSSRVFKVETDDGSVTEVEQNSGYYIVGAGVSTCAPTTEIPL